MKIVQKQALVAVAALFVVLGLAWESSAKTKHPGTSGTVVRVEDHNVILEEKKGKNTTEVTIVTDENTQVKIDGKDATVVDLKPGMHVTVPAYEDVATRINATSDHSHKKE